MLCDNDQRRALLRAHRDKKGKPDLNGLDYVEVADDGLTLQAYFIGKLPDLLKLDRPALNNFLKIEGGRRVRNIRVLDVDPHVDDQAGNDDYLIITLDKSGDFSTYSLRLVGVEGIDPRYERADFTFKIDCASDLDCLPAPCPPEPLNEPEINYLAKDYASFRQLLLDRLALIMPGWTERHVPDIGLTLVEILAYAGDHLSYYQDAVATEAYLDTARQRISLRRHARLVDYFLHEGCNARAWLALSVFGAPSFDLDLTSTNFFAQLNQDDSLARDVLTQEEFQQLAPGSYEVFEPMQNSSLTLREAHNEIHFYSWGQRECCLPRGSTSASLLDGWLFVEPPAPAPDQPPADTGTSKPPIQPKVAPDVKRKPPIWPGEEVTFTRLLNLQPGDVLIFEEVIGPKTGNPADADPLHRVAVRLTKVSLNEDSLILVEVDGGQKTPDGPITVYQRPTPVLDIEWQAEDALPFALCLSAVSSAPECRYLENVSVARGNVLLVDHGLAILPPEELGTVPLDHTQAECDCEGQASEVTYLPGPFRPVLRFPGITYRQPLPADDPQNNQWVSAKSLIGQDPRAALPQVLLNEVPAAPDADAAGGLLPLFKFADIEDPTQLVQNLLNPQNAAEALLRLRLSSKTEKDLQQYKPGDPLSPALLADLRADLNGLLRTWEPLFDLLRSGPDDLNFVVEVDNEGRAHLRFGDNDLGERPPAGSSFYASYRTGNGVRGNLGAESISHIVLLEHLNGVDLRARNPLPSLGGVDPEPMAEARLFAPTSFRSTLERAILADDYAAITKREFSSELQGAATELAWTGSWYEADVALDPLNSESIGPGLALSVGRRIDQFRRMGHDLHIEQAQYVPLDIELSICVDSSFLRGHVKAALLELFSNRLQSNGQPGFFHPDRLSFGDDIYLSQLVATAQGVAGVSSVEVTKLQRLFAAPNREIENGLLPLGPFEIAQVDNDPNFPEHGHFNLVMAGGR